MDATQVNILLVVAGMAIIVLILLLLTQKEEKKETYSPGRTCLRTFYRRNCFWRT